MHVAEGIDLFYKVVPYECSVLSRSFKPEVNSHKIQYNAALGGAVWWVKLLQEPQHGVTSKINEL